MSHSAQSYDAEQTTVQAFSLGSGVHPPAIAFFGEPAYGDNLHRRLSHHMRHPWRNGGSAHPCALPRIWGRFHGVCFSAYVKTSRLRDTASWSRADWAVLWRTLSISSDDVKARPEARETAHFMCAVNFGKWMRVLAC
ncbi:hypothetical protein [Desulfosporosinus sp. FKB]|uniref:hypothetical protein n=1 Tax=Desulfosporosinus sp. FKB TaxID=1969835 RepID=UPI001124DEE9|nr:hypothetical protein [Desulfosporosinus sp. FKB]